MKRLVHFFSGLIAGLLIHFAGLAEAGELLFVASGDNQGNGGGIYACEFSEGALSQPSKVFPLPAGASLALSSDKKRLYASSRPIERSETGELIAFKVLPEGKLQELNRVPFEVNHYCSLTGSKDRRTLLGASFDAGVVASYRLKDDGSIAKQVSKIALPRFARGKSDLARAHDVEFNRDETLACVSDIANNRVYVFDVDSESGALVQRSFVSSDSFAGPRHQASLHCATMDLVG